MSVAALRVVDNPATTAAALYVRRSHKDAEGSARNGHSLAEQERDCRALAAHLGLEVVVVYAEKEGTGASARSRKARPVWDSALADLDEGSRFRTLIVWALDRADRRGAREVVDLLERHAGKDRRVLGVDGTDTGDERRRLELVIRAEIAREEAENIARRVTRTKRSRRDAGRWLGGRPPFGLRVVDGRLDHDPERYPLARRIAEEALAGRSLWAIAGTLNAEEIPSPSGKSWRAGAIAQILRAPAFAGLAGDRRRTASGGWAAIADVYVDDSGSTVSVGRGVISPGERARLLRVLDSRTAEATTGERKGRRTSGSVLGGVLRCAHCGGRTSLSGSGERRYLRCADAANAPGSCEGFSAPLRATVEAVSSSFLQRLAALDVEDPLVAEIAARWTVQVDPESVEARRVAEDAVEEARAALRRVQDLALAGVLTPEEAGERTPALRDRLARAEERLAEVAPSVVDVSPVLDLARSREAWDALEDRERRDLLVLAVSRVDVTRAGGRGRHFRPEERLRITWTDGTVSTPA